MARSGAAPTVRPEDVPASGAEAKAEPAAAPASASDPIASPPPGRARALAGAVIAVWLVAQVALPVSYYLGGSLAEERFAWRMFSSVSAYGAQCALSVVETVSAPGAPEGRITREPDLARILHAAWLAHLHRGRALAIDRFLTWRCLRDPSIIAIEFRRSCDRGPEAGLRTEVSRQCQASTAAGEASR